MKSSILTFAVFVLFAMTTMLLKAMDVGGLPAVVDAGSMRTVHWSSQR